MIKEEAQIKGSGLQVGHLFGYKRAVNIPSIPYTFTALKNKCFLESIRMKILSNLQNQNHSLK